MARVKAKTGAAGPAVADLSDAVLVQAAEVERLRKLIRSVVALGCPAIESPGHAPDLCAFCKHPAPLAATRNLNRPEAHAGDCPWPALVVEAADQRFGDPP